MSKLKNKAVIIFVISLIVLYGIIYIIPKVTGALVSSYTAGYGELKITDDVAGYLVRDEKVYVSETGGKANRYIDSGTLVRKGTTVMEVTGGSDDEIDAAYTGALKRLGDKSIPTGNFSVSDGGVISYYTDGYEGQLTPETMEKGNFAYYRKLSQANVIDLKRDNVVAGEPVFKVVDRTKWYIVCYVDKKHMDRYELGDEVTVEFKSDFVEAEVYKIDKEGSKARIILSTDHYFNQFARTRVADVSLVTSDVKGLIIDNDSITEEKGVKGVYVQEKTGEYVFVPIMVRITDGKQSVIMDTYFDDDNGQRHMTVEIYDEVLKNPN